MQEHAYACALDSRRCALNTECDTDTDRQIDTNGRSSKRSQKRMSSSASRRQPPPEKMCEASTTHANAYQRHSAHFSVMARTSIRFEDSMMYINAITQTNDHVHMDIWLCPHAPNTVHASQRMGSLWEQKLHFARLSTSGVSGSSL